MMDFSKLTLEDSGKLRSFFDDNSCRVCDFTFGCTFMWRDLHKTEYAIHDETLYFKAFYPEQAFAPPLGKNAGKHAYEKIIELCETDKTKPLICSVSEDVLRKILEMFPNAGFRTCRDWSDYIYFSEDLKSLSGRKYSGQRNQIAKFIRDNYSWKFEKITSQNADEIKAFLKIHAKEHKKDSPTYKEGNAKAHEIIDNLEIYNALGGVLTAGGRVVGAALGEIAGDTLYVHVEKADISHRGAYQMLTNQFALMYAGDDVKYINREEDDGDEGLRASKLSYHPAMLADKYFVELMG